jgi:hypothetical protein
MPAETPQHHNAEGVQKPTCSGEGPGLCGRLFGHFRGSADRLLLGLFRSTLASGDASFGGIIDA